MTQQNHVCDFVYMIEGEWVREGIIFLKDYISIVPSSVSWKKHINTHEIPHEGLTHMGRDLTTDG